MGTLDRRRRYLRFRETAVRLGFQVWSRTARGPVARMFLNDLIAHTGNFSSVNWLGIPIWQNVLDLWTIQETISELRPALLIETGTHRSGSALFYAHLMDLLGTGRVLTIDVQPLRQIEHPRIEYVTGSSVDPIVVEHATEAAARAEGPVMVILDADHARAHVARELELYAPLVTVGSWLLSQDGVIDRSLIFADSRPGPLGANRAFLAHHPEFVYDRERNERFIVTHHPKGWLRRVG